MTRNTILTILAVVAVVVGVPVGIVSLAGGGDDDAPSGGAAAGQAYPEGIDVDNAPEEQRDSETRDQGPGNGKQRERGGGPPQHAKSFDKTMAGVDYPAAITESGSPAVLAVERAAGAEVEPGQQTVIGADCRKRVCHVRYRSGPRGTGLILATQARILRRLFANADIRRVVLYVHHKTTGRKKEERPAFIVVDCRRSAGVVWSRLKAKQIARRCRLTDQAGGNLRNQVRRGNVSVADASRGRGADGGGQAASSGPSAPPGADPAGTPAPENVNPKRGGRDAERDGG